MTAYDSLWQLMTTYDSLWQLMTTYDSLWQLMTAYDTFWHLLTPFDTFWHLLTRVPRWLTRPLLDTAAVDPEPHRNSYCSVAPCPGSIVMLPSSGLMTRASPQKFLGLNLSSLALAEQDETVVRCPQHHWCLGYWYCRGGESHQAELLTNIL